MRGPIFISRNLLLVISFASLTLPLGACGEQETATVGQTFGPSPALPEPETSVFPTVNIAKAIGWPEGGKPVAARGMAVSAFATGLDHPRTLLVLPNGDVLVAETNAPKRPEENTGIKGLITKLVMTRAGADTQSANRITLLRDANGDGVAETRSVFLEGLNSPFGMALVGDDFYVANSDAIMKFPYSSGDTRITAPGVKVADLPAGPLNHHWTKDLTAHPDGTRLYATVGSNSNIGENGMDKETNRAAVLEIDRTSGKSRVFASGLRNPNGPAWQPQSGALWVVVNERDELGNDLVPDYMTSVKDGGFYGWPYSYYGQHVDARVQPQRPDLVAKAIVPDYALGAHTASLGLAFNTGKLFPPEMANGAFVGQHGSWNRKPHSGYKVIFVPFANGMPSGKPQDVLTGFLTDEGEARGRPVGVAIDRQGALLVADDVGNAIWRVTPAAKSTAQ
ncbi:MAG TPA: sorbosone dehydrogenase family protein [Bradyrhizobium sp.]|jgi:glucose/arabinose dehydrogenase|uniref:PQQ-dependent sugar dehydrogenase n=1 Tax=Bradyrhizobium sp. TaxID=376 RepID=UPI002BFE8CD7|nr:sorbosone dehydrogenase family protein [Bradyrhizobium sp.]HXB79203.1 sorbosone dehydrogenase family protein [Bradyrhizobium sp.]